MTDEQRLTAGDKALLTWGSNRDRHSRITAVLSDSDHAPALVSSHTDTKSAYTVRTRLARRYPALEFKVYRGEGGEGLIWAKHRDGSDWPSTG